MEVNGRKSEASFHTEIIVFISNTQTNKHLFIILLSHPHYILFLSCYNTYWTCDVTQVCAVGAHLLDVLMQGVWVFIQLRTSFLHRLRAQAGVQVRHHDASLLFPGFILCCPEFCGSVV